MIDSVLGTTDQLLFLHGWAGTGKTFTIKALIRELARLRKKGLITGTTGIAVVQYQRGTTVHSPVKLGIDEATKGDFRSNIGRNAFQANHIRSADLMVIDEVSMLTP
jgi:DNA replication protein DnaC